MLFNPKHRGKLNAVFIAVSIIVVLGMVLLYIPSLFS